MRKAFVSVLVLMLLTVTLYSTAVAADSPFYSVAAFDEYCTRWNNYYNKTNPRLNGAYFLSDDETDIGACYIHYNDNHFSVGYSSGLIPATSSFMVMYIPAQAVFMISIMDDNLKSNLEDIVLYGKDHQPILPELFKGIERYNVWTITINPSDVLELYSLDSVQMELTIDGEKHQIEISDQTKGFLYKMFDWQFGGILYAGCGSDDFEDPDMLPSTNQSGAAKAEEKYAFRDDVDGINKAAKSVFYVDVFDDQWTPVGTASGFVAFDEHLFVTNQHVIEDAAFLMICDDDGNRYILDQVVAADEKQDIALLLFPEGNQYAALPLNPDDVRRGESVVAIGSPQGLQNSISKGDISAIREDEDVKLIQISASLSQGSSGGALFDNKGKVIGITTSQLIEGQNLNFAVSIQNVIQIYNQWNKKDHKQLGAVFNLVNSQQTAEAGDEPGLYIENDAGILFMYPYDWEVEAMDTDGTKNLIISSASSDFSLIKYYNEDLLSIMSDDYDIRNNPDAGIPEEIDDLFMGEELAAYLLSDYGINTVELKNYGDLLVYAGKGEIKDEEDSELSAYTMGVYFVHNGYANMFIYVSIDAYEKDMVVFENILNSVQLL